ncbi:MAG: hypothetical protein M3229_05270 [Actinomycetota bacterium]|nr:hypothetical protein [Actinomycetota bacterium]
MNEPQNRDQRRDEQFHRDHAERRQAQAEQQERKLIEGRTPQDVTSVRAKSQGHGKKTADKWNQ